MADEIAAVWIGQDFIDGVMTKSTVIQTRLFVEEGASVDVVKKFPGNLAQIVFASGFFLWFVCGDSKDGGAAKPERSQNATSNENAVRMQPGRSKNAARTQPEQSRNAARTHPEHVQSSDNRCVPQTSCITVPIRANR